MYCVPMKILQLPIIRARKYKTIHSVLSRSLKYVVTLYVDIALVTLSLYVVTCNMVQNVNSCDNMCDKNMRGCDM